MKGYLTRIASRLLIFQTGALRECENGKSSSVAGISRHLWA